MGVLRKEVINTGSFSGVNQFLTSNLERGGDM